MPGGRQSRRFRKRTFVVTGISLLCIMLIAGLIAFMATLNLGSADLVRISITASDSRSTILGSGVSIAELETGNLLSDPSFEPYVFRQALTVYHGDDKAIIVSSEDAAAGYFDDGFFNGADARIMTWTDDGMVLKKTARVSNYGINRVGVFQKINLPGDIPDNSVINDFAVNNDLTLAVGNNGLIVRNAAGQTPEIIDTGLRSDLTAISAFASGFIACSNAGDLLFSEDGYIWNFSENLAGAAITAIAGSADGRFAAIDNSGNLYTGDRQIQSQAYYRSSSALNDIVYSQGAFVAVGNGGVILSSRNGLIWQRCSVDSNANWYAADFLDGLLVVTGEKGRILLCAEDGQFTVLESGQETDFVDIIMLSRQQLIALSADGEFFISNDGGHNWQQSSIDPGMHSSIIAMAGKDKIISADSEGALGLAQLAAEILLDAPLREGSYLAGDLIYLELVTAQIPPTLMGYRADGLNTPDFWEYHGPGNFSRSIDDSAPGGGVGSIEIVRSEISTTEPSIISQYIGTGQSIGLASGEIIEIEIWLRHEGAGENEVQAWLSGPFEAVGTTISQVGSNWRKYNYAFVFPEPAVRDELPIYFNIAYSGRGRLWIDRVHLGPATEKTGEAAILEREILQRIQPAALRLDFLNIGQRSGGKEDWSLPLNNENVDLQQGRWQSKEGNSLHAGLQLALGSMADPWLVIDSHISESEMIHLIEYLSAPVSEYYGRLRQQNGSVVPWTDQFKRIYLEFTDRDDIFQSDRNRAYFVDLMIRTIGRSSHYQQIKSQLVFIDGMPYDEGVMLSRADYHTADLVGYIQNSGTQAIAQAYAAYFDQMPRNPEKPAQTWTEFIRMATLYGSGSNVPTTADLVHLLLFDLGRQTSLANLGLPARSSGRWSETWAAAASVAAAGARGEPLIVDFYSSGSEIITENTEGIGAFGFISDSQISVVLTNQSHEMVTCELLTELNLRGAAIVQYDSEGLLLSRQTFRRQESRINLLPGGVTLIVKIAG